MIVRGQLSTAPRWCRASRATRLGAVRCGASFRGGAPSRDRAAISGAAAVIMCDGRLARRSARMAPALPSSRQHDGDNDVHLAQARGRVQPSLCPPQTKGKEWRTRNLVRAGDNDHGQIFPRLADPVQGDGSDAPAMSTSRNSTSQPSGSSRNRSGASSPLAKRDLVAKRFHPGAKGAAIFRITFGDGKIVQRAITGNSALIPM